MYRTPAGESASRECPRYSSRQFRNPLLFESQGSHLEVRQSDPAKVDELFNRNCLRLVCNVQFSGYKKTPQPEMAEGSKVIQGQIE